MLTKFLRAVRPQSQLTYSNSSSQSASTYTYTNISIGNASANRLVAVFVVGSNASSVSVSSITIGGNSATLASNTQVTGNFFTGVGYLSVPTGTTATVVVNFSATARDVGVFVYSLTGLYSTTPVNSQSSASSSGASKTLTMTTRQNGIVLAAAICGTSTSSITWSSPLTVQSTLTNVTRLRTSASGYASSTSTAVTITPNVTDFTTLVSATWR